MRSEKEGIINWLLDFGKRHHAVKVEFGLATGPYNEEGNREHYRKKTIQELRTIRENVLKPIIYKID